jgi:hypothetical protein
VEPSTNAATEATRVSLTIPKNMVVAIAHPIKALAQLLGERNAKMVSKCLNDADSLRALAEFMAD